MANNILIYGRTGSSHTQKVLWALDELGLPHKLVDAGGSFELNGKNPKYLELNPNGLVPTMDDHGFIMWESNAIIRYLNTKYGKAERSIEDKAREDMWMDWSRDLAAAVGPAFVGYIRTPAENRDMKHLNASTTKTAELLAILEAQLAKHDYVAGAEFSAADITVAPFIWRYYNLPIERPSFPHVEAWRARVASRPGHKWVAIPLA